MLAAVADDTYLNDKSASKRRNVAVQFAHLHNVRLMWTIQAATDLMLGLVKVERKDATDRKGIIGSLDDSGTAIEKLLRKGIKENRVKGINPHPFAFWDTSFHTSPTTGVKLYYR